MTAPLYFERERNRARNQLIADICAGVFAFAMWVFIIWQIMANV